MGKVCTVAYTFVMSPTVFEPETWSVLPMARWRNCCLLCARFSLEWFTHPSFSVLQRSLQELFWTTSANVPRPPMFLWQTNWQWDLKRPAGSAHRCWLSHIDLPAHSKTRPCVLDSDTDRPALSLGINRTTRKVGFWWVELRWKCTLDANYLQGSLGKLWHQQISYQELLRTDPYQSWRFFEVVFNYFGKIPRATLWIDTHKETSDIIEKNKIHKRKQRIKQIEK